MEKYGTPLPRDVLESIRANGVALKGPITTPVGSGFRSVNVALRKELDLYAQPAPVQDLPGRPDAATTDVDLVIVRENTEDLYAGIEFEQGTPETRGADRLDQGLAGRQIRDDSGISIKPICVTRHAAASSSSRSTTRAATAGRRSPRCTRRTS